MYTGFGLSTALLVKQAINDWWSRDAPAKRKRQQTDKQKQTTHFFGKVAV